ncbi:fibronectin type III domain-containing protein [Microbacterium sp. Au-Mic1]|uniref:fibronectin type III domain-containing protein n=1 Tax=Microbacterium sp. Au-Mic1 TaxID=2906457 RepID=UPI001E283BC4|nr:fibronectin type III domain-containing protein [Microbacterium sp. Au-Mic1]MCE4024659.1 fibronectin type III domain-containing protein [Microbacterium sp. Au-Mic1]
MADHAVGAAGTLSIVDNGWDRVELWVRCSDPATNDGGYQWGGVVNGVGVGGTVSLGAGFGSRLLGAWTVTTSQNVTISQYNTGTYGLGGAASFTDFVFRSTVPATPGAPVASELGPTSMRLTWTIPGNGGSSIDQMLLRRSTDPAFGTYTDFPQSAGATTAVVSGLTPGTKYYWRVYAHNARGYSASSAITNATTLSGFKHWNGTTWQPTILRAWDGTQWKVCQLKAWDGTTWKVCG